MLTTAQNAVLNDETCTTTSHEKFPIYPLQNYTATNFFSQQCVYRYSDWLCSAFVKCPVQLEAVTSPSPPRQPSGIWQWSVPREWGIWHKRHSGSAGFETCPGEVGNLNRNCSESLSSGVLSSFNFCHRGDTNLNCAHTSTTHSVLEATASSWSMTVLR